MRVLLLTALLWALASAKPEMYKETEDFQYSRSSSDDGSKSGFYGAQRGNMGGNYEKAHNMDSLAQHHLSTLVRQVDGELGEGANTRTGSAYTAGNSRGIYGSGSYDLSNLKGRNFGESGSYGDSNSRSSMYQNGHASYGSNSASYGSEQLHSSSSQQSGYAASNVASQYSASDVGSADKYQGANSYDYGSQGGSNLRYYSLANSQARHGYDQSNANLYSTYGSSDQNKLIATPVRVYVRPGGRVAVPISAQTYALRSSSVQDKNVASASSDSASDVVSNSGVDMAYKPTSSAKHYESAYSYRKKWEKHDTQPLVIVPTENPFPANSELYEDRLDQAGQQYQHGLDSSNHLSNVNSGYSAKNNYESEASSHAQSSKASSAYSSGYSNTKSASAHQARYQTQALNKDVSASSNAYSLDAQNLGSSTSNLNNLVEDINSKPKSYQSSYSYHKSWERRGDPYVIVPTGDASAQTSQRLIAASKNQNQYSSHQYGTQYDQNSVSSDRCDIICHQRKKRSYNMNQFEQDADDSQSYLGQQLENGWDLGQQTENKFEKLEDLGQETQNNWDSLTNLDQQTQDDFGQQTENENAKLEDLGQETQNQFNKFEDLGQQTQGQWEDLGQQTQNQWGKLEDLGQQTQGQWEDLGQQAQNQWGKLENLGQQTQSQWKDLGQQNQKQWEDLGQQAQSQWDNLGQQSQSQWDNLGQQTQNQWDKLESLGQQSAHRESPNENLNNNTEDNATNDKQDKIAKDENNSSKTTDHKFLWDEISQMFEEPPKSEVTSTDLKQREQSISVEQSNKNQEQLSIESLLNTLPDDHEKDKTPTKPFEIGHDSINSNEKQTERKPDANQRLWDALEGLYNIPNQDSHLHQETELMWSDLGQQTQNEKTEQNWSNLGYQTQNEWSNLGQQTHNEWSDMGQQTHNDWSDLGQQTQNEWSDLGQQTHNEWSDLGHQTQKESRDLGQQTQNEWSDLGQQTHNEWSDLGQQTHNEWSDLSQQTHNKWKDLDQQTQNLWGNLDQDTQKQWGSSGQQIHNQWSGSSEQIHKQWNYLDNVGHHTQFYVDQQQNLGQNKRVIEEKLEVPTDHKHQQGNEQHQQETQQIENLHRTDKEKSSHNVETLSQNELIPKNPIVMIKEQDSSTSTTTQKQIIQTHDKDIGRGDIGADNDSSNFEILDFEPLSSTTKKPRNGHQRPGSQQSSYSHFHREVQKIEKLNPENQIDLSVKPIEDKLTEQKESQFEQQYVDLQQSQQNWDSSDIQSHNEPIYVTPSVIPPHTAPEFRSLSDELQLEATQQKKFEIEKFGQFIEKEKKHDSENLQSSPEKPIQVEAPVEPTTEKPGFWGSVWNKTKKAKDTVSSWFKG